MLKLLTQLWGLMQKYLEEQIFHRGKIMSPTPAKHNLIFGKMSSADFYPKGTGNEIDVIVAAPKDTRVFPGELVIVEKEIYQELLEALKDMLAMIYEGVPESEWDLIKQKALGVVKKAEAK